MSGYLFSIGATTAIFVLLASSLNIITGYAGQAMMGHAAFFGIGAYTAAILTNSGLSFWLALPASLVVTGACGALLGIASDDAHFSSDSPMWKGGWLMVNARERTHESILSAIRAGNYYSTSGPEFYDISVCDDRIHVETSPVQFIKLVGPAWKGHGRAIGMLENAEPITSADFDIPHGWKYAYIEIEDRQNRRAWTNNLLIEE